MVKVRKKHVPYSLFPTTKTTAMNSKTANGLHVGIVFIVLTNT